MAPVIAQNLEIRTEDLFKSFGDKSVLRGLNLDVQRGQMVAVIGGSGGGKTTLLKLLTAQEKPDRGRAFVADHEAPGSPLIDLAKSDEKQLDRLRRHWAVVFQGNALFSGTVYDNLAFALRDLKHEDELTIRARIEQAIQSVELDVHEDLQLNVDELSGGMAKRVAIARALVLDPILMFYDEPTSGLDPILTSEIHELIRTVHMRQPEGDVARTSIIVTHDRDLLLRLQPRIIMLHEGRIFFDGTYDAFSHSESPIIRPYYEVMPVLQQRVQTSLQNSPTIRS
jgi:phospholipid/cholesterol/gamma-HCH transport system ATP-binding protein